MLGVQLLACVVKAAWGVLTTVILLYVIEKTIGIRLTREEELQGCDLVEHGIGEEDEGEFERGAQMKQGAAFEHRVSARNNTSTENVSGEAAEASVEGTFTSTFVMRLPIIARKLRRKNGNTRRFNEETTTAHIDSSADVRRNDEDPRTSDDSDTSTPDIGRYNKGIRGSDDLRSIYSVDSDIEELLRREGKTRSESCNYPMNAQKRTVDKCIQVACEQGVLIDL